MINGKPTKASALPHRRTAATSEAGHENQACPKHQPDLGLGHHRGEVDAFEPSVDGVVPAQQETGRTLLESDLSGSERRGIVAVSEARAGLPVERQIADGVPVAHVL